MVLNYRSPGYQAVIEFKLPFALPHDHRAAFIDYFNQHNDLNLDHDLQSLLRAPAEPCYPSVHSEPRGEPSARSSRRSGRTHHRAPPAPSPRQAPPHAPESAPKFAGAAAPKPAPKPGSASAPAPAPAPAPEPGPQAGAKPDTKPQAGNATVRNQHLAALGFADNATPSLAEIKKAYHLLAMKLHPDKTGGDAALAEQFKQVNNAKEALLDEYGVK